jgi:hypothetical protein
VAWPSATCLDRTKLTQKENQVNQCDRSDGCDSTGTAFPVAAAAWQGCGVTDLSQKPWFADAEWLTVPDLVETLGVSVSRVHRLVEEHVLLATKVGGVTKVPAVFVVDGEPMHELRGTATVLADNGFTDDEAIDWMLSVEESLGTSPIAALRAGRKAEVRRVAQSLL